MVHPPRAETSASMSTSPPSTALPYRSPSAASAGSRSNRSSRSTSTRSSTSTTNPSLYRQRYNHRRSGSSQSRGLARRVPYKRSVLGVYIRHPDISDERQRELRRQQRERESLRSLAEFLKHTEPPPGHWMSLPETKRTTTRTSNGRGIEGRNTQDTEGSNGNRSGRNKNRTRRWSAPLRLGGVLGQHLSSSSLSSSASAVLRRRKKNNGGRRSHKGRFKSKNTRPSPRRSTSSSTYSPPRIRLPDTAVAGRTTGGYRHIAISIPLEHSQFGPAPRSQYPVFPSDSPSPESRISAASPPPPIRRTPATAATPGRHKPRTAVSPSGAHLAPNSLNPVSEAPELPPLPALSRHQPQLHRALQPAGATAHQASGRDTLSRSGATTTIPVPAHAVQGSANTRGAGRSGKHGRQTSTVTTSSTESSVRPSVAVATNRLESAERVIVRPGHNQSKENQQATHRRLSSTKDPSRPSTISSVKKMELPPIPRSAPLSMTPAQTSLDKGKGKAVEVTPPPSREAPPSSSKAPSVTTLEDRRNRVRELRLRDISAARSQRRQRSSTGGSSISLPLAMTPAAADRRQVKGGLPRLALTNVMVVANIQPTPTTTSPTSPGSSVVRPPRSESGFSGLSSRLSGMIHPAAMGTRWKTGRVSGGSEMTPPQSPKDAAKVKKGVEGDAGGVVEDDDEKWREVELRLQRLEANKDAWGIALRRVLEKLGPEQEGAEREISKTRHGDVGLDGWEDFESSIEKLKGKESAKETTAPDATNAVVSRSSAKVWRDSVPLLLRDDDESDHVEESDDAGDGKRLSIRTWDSNRKSKESEREGGGTGTPKWKRISPDSDLDDRTEKKAHSHHHHHFHHHGHGHGHHHSHSHSHKHSRSGGKGSGSGHRRGASMTMTPAVRASGLDTLGSLMQEITSTNITPVGRSDADTASAALARRREREAESESRKDNRKGMVLLPEEHDEFTMI